MRRFIVRFVLIVCAVPQVSAVQFGERFDSPFELEISGRRYHDVEPALPLDERDAALALRWRPDYSHGNVGLRGDIWAEALEGDVSGRDEEVYVGELSLNYWLDSGVVGGGRTLFVEGPGYIWNPANPFNDFRLNNQDRARAFKREGDPYLLYETYFAASSLTLMAVDYEPLEQISPASRESLPSAALRFSRVFERSDLTATLADLDGSGFASLAYAITLTDQLELHAEVAGSESNSRHFPVAVPAEGTVDHYRLRQSKLDDSYVDALLGLQYTFKNQINLIFEYAYNGSGYDKEDFNELLAAIDFSRTALADSAAPARYAGFLAEVAGLTGFMRREYLFARVSVPNVVNKLDTNVYMRLSPDDDGRIDGLLLEYDMTQAVRLRLNVERFSGDARSENGLIPYDNTATVSVTAVF